MQNVKKRAIPPDLVAFSLCEDLSFIGSYILFDLNVLYKYPFKKKDPENPITANKSSNKINSKFKIYYFRNCEVNTIFFNYLLKCFVLPAKTSFK